MIKGLAISTGILAIAAMVSLQKLQRTRSALAVARHVSDTTAKERDAYADAAAAADSVVTALDKALTDIRTQAKVDSLRLVAERNWWARRAKQDGARLDSLAKSLTSDSTLVCDDLFSRSSW